MATDSKSRIPERVMAVKVPEDLLMRLHLEAVRSERTLRQCVIDALDDHLPQRIEIITSGERGAKQRASRRSLAGASEAQVG